MAQIVTIDDAKNMARKLGDNVAATARERQDVISSLIKETTEIDGNSEELQVLGTLMSMPDDQFELIAPIFLEEIEKSYNEPNNVLLLAQTTNTLGYSKEDALQEYEAICKELDTLTTSISAPKISFVKQFLGLSYNAIMRSEGIPSRIINIPIVKLNEDVKLPTYAHVNDSGMDVYALDDITVAPGETKLVPTGIKVAIPDGYEIQVRPKSGRCLKTKLRVANTPGTIDSGYRSEIGVIIENVDPPIRAIDPKPDGTIDASCITYGQPYTIGKGEKFAQLVLCAVPKIVWTEVSDISQIGDDRNGGFGSSGLK